jgi:NhaP-type Na+/H+ or K+/H+ antiporter
MQIAMRYQSEISGRLYWQLGTALSTALIVGTFAAMWVFCLHRFGFPAGFILGWIAAPTTAVVAGSVMMMLWSLPLAFQGRGD